MVTRKTLRDALTFALLLIFAATWLCGCGAADEPTQPAADGPQPVGEPYELVYGLQGEWSAEWAVHSFTAQALDNGGTRFCLDFTHPGGLNGMISDNSAEAFSIFLDYIEESGRTQLTVDLTEEQFASAQEATLSFWFTGDNSSNDILFQLRPLVSGGEPVGESSEVTYTPIDEMQSGDAAIHSFTLQPLDNGSIRYCLEYSMPEGLDIYMFDSRGGDESDARFLGTTKGGQDRLVFEFSEEQFSSVGEMTINFIRDHNDEDRFLVIFNTQPIVSGGEPVGEPRTLSYELTDELHAEGARIHSLTAQELDNGYTRYTLDYTLPEGLSIFIFNAPDGDSVAIGTGPTEGERAELVFDLGKKQIRSCIEGCAIMFYNDGSESYLVWFRP